VKMCALLLWLQFGVAVCAQQGVPARILLDVRDDEGRPLPDVDVDGCFTDVSTSGQRSTFRGRTDGDGHYVAEGEALIGLHARFTREGFYATTIQQGVARVRSPGGQGYAPITRWDDEFVVQVKRIRNPIPMYMVAVENPHVSAFDGPGRYRLGRTSQFDFVAGSFLPPWGKGVTADLEFVWQMRIFETNRAGRAIHYDSSCAIRTIYAGSGVRRGHPDGSENGLLGSSLISAYVAPGVGYTNALSFTQRVDGLHAESNDDGHHLYYFRIRTQTNEAGEVTNALYGKIYGQLNGNFRYYLNPTPNDRNVEFDPKRNLFTEP
jgi:hypothetical protein